MADKTWFDGPLNSLITLVDFFCALNFGSSVLLIMNWYRGALENIDVSEHVTKAAVTFVAMTVVRLVRMEIKPTYDAGHIERAFASMPVEVQQLILEHATRHSSCTFKSLLLASRWTNELAISARCMQGFVIRLTSVSRLRSFSDFLGKYPMKARDVRHLLLYTEDIANDGSSIVQQFTGLVSLGCTENILRQLRPQQCRRLSFLSLEAFGLKPGDSADRVLFEGMGDALDGINYMHLAAPPPGDYASIGITLFGGIKHLILDSTLVSALTVGVSADAAQISTFGILSFPGIERIAYLSYGAGFHVPFLNAGALGRQIKHMGHVATWETDWKGVFVRCVEDEEYVWKLAGLAPKE